MPAKAEKRTARVTQTEFPEQFFYQMRYREYSHDLLHDEAFDHIADLDVVELLHLHAAFVAARDLLDVVLETAQGRKLALVNDDIVTQDANLAAALDLAVGAVAAADGADLGDLVGLAHLGMADDDFLELGGSR